MVFSSLVFLLIFLPCVIVIYYIIPKTFRNGFLLFASLLFFSWAGVRYSVLIFLSILVNFIVGRLLIFKHKKLFLAIGLIFNVGMLVIFKYANFIVANLNEISSFLSIKLLPQPHIILPIGISFYTFQAMSYLIDVYYGRTQIQQRIDHLGLYISLFPQLIAGPIVRYHEIKDQLLKRVHSIDAFSVGIKRFTIGLGKKVLIANTFALIVDQIFATPIGELDALTAWMGIILYSLQIYFDFSGYSDMALGLGRMFGFRIPENFNFPYISRSISEFWRRWHITLSNWFRDYLYIPIGGNRRGKARTYRNLIIVFIITGFWHGASWTFLIWGLFHGTFLLIEKIGFGKFLKKSWKPFQHIYALLVVLFAWVFFRSENLSYAFDYCKTMLGLTHFESVEIPFILRFYNTKSLIILLVGILASTPFFEWLINKVTNDPPLRHKRFKSILIETVEYSKIVFLIAILILCVVELAIGTYNPFIYFRF